MPDAPKPALPWKILSSKYLYEDAFIKFRLDEVEQLKNGKHTTRTVVEKRPFVTILALTDNNEVVMVGQYRYANQLYSWEVPMGYTDNGETDVLESAKRELREETGYTAKNWTALGMHYVAHGNNAQQCYAFLAQDLTPGTAQQDDTEDLALKLLPLPKVIDMIKTNEIFDGATIVTVLRAQEFFLKK